MSELKIIKFKKVSKDNYKIVTPEIVEEYKNRYKKLLKKVKNKDEVIRILFDEVYALYIKKENLNISMEKIHIKTKLGSYLSGGCGIGPSLLTSLVGSSLFAYINSCLKKLTSPIVLLYCSIVVFLAIYLLTIQDNQVEMYNLFLETLERIEKGK